MSHISKILHTGSDLEAIQAQKELLEKLDSVDFSDTDGNSRLPIFYWRQNDDKIPKGLYGSLDTGEDSSTVTTNIDVKVIPRLNPIFRGVSAICPLTDNNALIDYFDLQENDIQCM